MKNKYDNYFWEFEKKYKQKGREIDKLLEEQFNLLACDKKYQEDYLDSICLDFHLYDKKLKEWVFDEIFEYFTKETIISCYLIKLTDALMLKDKHKLNSIMTSFKSIKLIKDVVLQGNVIILITNNDDEIRVKNLFKDEYERNEFRSRCHSGCEFLIKNEEVFAKDSSIITLRDRYIGKYPVYHSVILAKGKYIIDPARNMIMKLTDYKKLLKPYLIMSINRDLMLKEIEYLSQTDEQFNQSSLNNVLKLAINRQIKK